MVYCLFCIETHIFVYLYVPFGYSYSFCHLFKEYAPFKIGETELEKSNVKEMRGHFDLHIYHHVSYGFYFPFFLTPPYPLKAYVQYIQ